MTISTRSVKARRAGAATFFLLSLLFTGATGSARAWSDGYDPYKPIFTPFDLKNFETSDQRFALNFRNQAVGYQPFVTTRDTEVHMAFYSGPAKTSDPASDKYRGSNRGKAVRVVESINQKSKLNWGCNAKDPNDPQTPQDTRCAVWIEGATTTNQYPLFVRLLEEHWYDRAFPNSDKSVTIYGKKYPNLFPLPDGLKSADQIWGNVSTRNVESIRGFYQATGKKVQVWALVQGAGQDRIFYQFEYPALQKLEEDKIITVHCAIADLGVQPDWQNDAHWSIGLGSAGCNKISAPLSAAVTGEPITVNER